VKRAKTVPHQQSPLTIAEQVEQYGFATVRNVISPQQIAELSHEIGLLDSSAAAGRRNLFDSVASVVRLAQSPELQKLVSLVLGDGAQAVKATLFNKTAETNWKVPWHQDLTITVKERGEALGFTAWSVKDAAINVQPPPEILANILAVRLHLDDCGVDNGALRVIAGSHRNGRLTQTQIEQVVDKEQAVCCAVSAGDAILLRPLLLHASSIATKPKDRRVVHLEYAAFALRDGLQWRHSI
jgi:ectoine hydroxylase-related dioxygenase (phytanoyl-CoA dioxygenase family)